MATQLQLVTLSPTRPGLGELVDDPAGFAALALEVAQRQRSPATRRAYAT